MNENLWNLYMQLQTTAAYGTGVSASPPSEGQATAAVAWVQRARPGAKILVVGPGGLPEVRVLREAAGEIHALTAHLPEVKIINESGLAFAAYGDVHSMPYLSGTFDVVYNSNVLEHAFAPYIALMECRRVLKDGGVGYFVMPTFEGLEGGKGPFHLHCLDNAVWCELLRKTGFTIADRVYQAGGSGYGGYHHFVCTAGLPPEPHLTMLKNLVTHKAV